MSAMHFSPAIDLVGLFSQNDFQPRRYSKGELIFLPGDRADQVYCIAEGRVKIAAVNADDKEIIKGIFVQGEVFGEAALLGEERRRDCAVALNSCRVYALPAALLLQLLEKQADWSLFFLQLIARRQMELERRLEALVFRNSRNRILEFLVETTACRGQRMGYEWVIRGPLTHRDIASLTATSRQTVTTLLNDLRAMKLLHFDRKRLLIRDLDQLRNLSRA